MTTQVCGRPLGTLHAVRVCGRINPPQLSLIPCPTLPLSDWPDSYDPGHKDLMLGRQSKHRLRPGFLTLPLSLVNYDTIDWYIGKNTPLLFWPRLTKAISMLLRHVKHLVVFLSVMESTSASAK